MLSRTNSSASLRSPGGTAKTKPTAYACKHELTTNRLNAVVAGLNIKVKTRKCPDCQIMTPDGALHLLEAIRKSIALKDVDAVTKRKLAETLFERLADKRRTALKEQWNDVSLSWAMLCYSFVPLEVLKNVCVTIKARYGAGVDKQMLQTLGRAACIQEKVWEIFEPREASMFATANHVVEDLRRRHEMIDHFAHVEDMFFAARELGKLCDTTVLVYNKVSQRLNRWGDARK